RWQVKFHRMLYNLDRKCPPEAQWLPTGRLSSPGKLGRRGGQRIPPRQARDQLSGRKLVHGVVLARGLERGLAGEIFLVIIADVASAHILVLHAGDALTDFGALDVLDVAEHRLVAKIFPREIVGAERR